MVKFSIRAPDEQTNPTYLLHDVLVMERYGIERCWSSDHYMPWWHTGYNWRGLASAWDSACQTDRIVVGTGLR